MSDSIRFTEISDNIHVILVRTLHGGNIGATARAMNNFGIRYLRLVAPATGINDDSYRMAMNSKHILENAIVYPDMESAIKDIDITVGLTRRLGRGRSRFFTPPALAEEISSAAKIRKVALVFGTEDTGLSNEEVDLCDWLVSIKTLSEFESLNLSHAVTVILYEINRYFLKQSETASDDNMLEGLYVRLEELLRKTEFLPEEGRDPKRAMLGLRRMISRGSWSKSEIELFHSIINSINSKIDSQWDI